MEIAFYENIKERSPKVWNVENYVGAVKFGMNQDCVIAARNEYQKNGKTKKYTEIKSNSMLVYPNGIFKEGQPKTNKNIIPNGIVCIDIDDGVTDDVIRDIQNDEYTYISHQSFKGKEGLCVWVKINPDKLEYAYDCISKYYKEKYDIITDQACRNPSRARFLSFDPDIYVNEKSKKFNVKIEKKDQLPKIQNFLHTDDSFDYILEQIRDRNIDLCQEDYFTYVRVGMSIASHFGEKGLDKFKFVCSFGSKYNERHADRDYKGFCKNNERISIGTFYYYAKNAGLELYTPKTKELINRVKISKVQGNPTVESIEQNMNALGYDLDDQDRATVQTLIDSKEDYSHLANEDLTDIEKIGNFIVDLYNPTRDAINKYKYINDKRMTDSTVDDIYITCVKNFPDIKVKKDDIRSILNSSLYMKTFNLLDEFIQENKDIETNNAIERVLNCIEFDENTDKEYAKWAFTKWIVSALHNWTCDESDPLVSPLVLVLCSSRMGSGKTYFFRTLMPPQLQSYFVEGKIDVANKDSKLRLARALVVLDDEMGGKSVKENEQFKSVTDMNEITERVPYGREDEVFKRRAILCGTSNEYNLLKDFTGKQRRILPMNIISINHDEYQKIDKTELIMEAYNLLKSGFDWKIYKEEDVDYLYENTAFNLDQLPVDDIFKMHFSFEENEEFNEKLIWNQGEIINFFHKFTPHKFTRYDVKHIMDKNFQRIKTYRVGEKTKQGYLFYRKDINSYEFPSDMQLDECPF